MSYNIWFGIKFYYVPTTFTKK